MQILLYEVISLIQIPVYKKKPLLTMVSYDATAVLPGCDQNLEECDARMLNSNKNAGLINI